MHVQHQNCHGPLCTANRLTYDIASIAETTTPIDKKFQDNIWTTKICLAMQYCDVITNPRWRTAAILKIAKSPYLSEKSSDCDKIWYTNANIEPDDSHVIKNGFLKIQDGGRPPFQKSLIRHISVKNRPILMNFGTLHQISNEITVT